MIKEALRAALRWTGFDLYRPDRAQVIPKELKDQARSDDVVRSTLLERAGIRLVLDVGANQGQYGLHLRQQGFTGRILSFEPLTWAFHQLAMHARSDTSWDVFRLGIGAIQGRLTMNVANNHGKSSSFLPMLPAHVDRVPDAAYTGTADVEVTTLSAFLEQHRVEERPIFAKVDVQGYEMEVLKGCNARLLEQIAGIEVELTCVPLYQGQALIDEVVAYLYTRGYYLVCYRPLYRPLRNDPRTHFALQADGIFVRAELVTGILASSP